MAEPHDAITHLRHLARHAEREVLGLLAASHIRHVPLDLQGWNPHQWAPLPGDAPWRRATDALDELERCAAGITNRVASSRTRELRARLSRVRAVVDQRNGLQPLGAPAATIDEVEVLVIQALTAVNDLVGALRDAGPPTARLLVAHPSALVAVPELPEWTVDARGWTVVLLPAVLGELDEARHDPERRTGALRAQRHLHALPRRPTGIHGVPAGGLLLFREDRDLQARVPDEPQLDVTGVVMAAGLELSWSQPGALVAVAAGEPQVRGRARWAGLDALGPERLCPAA